MDKIVLNEEEKAKLERKMRVAIFGPNREKEGNEMRQRPKQVSSETEVKFSVSRIQFALLIAVIDKAIELRHANVVLELIELKHKLTQPS